MNRTVDERSSRAIDKIAKKAISDVQEDELIAKHAGTGLHGSVDKLLDHLGSSVAALKTTLSNDAKVAEAIGINATGADGGSVIDSAFVDEFFSGKCCGEMLQQQD
eukprot:CAMPEP_0170173286 /NCGR_PEP_ID=MMETSP0040_2-20121228/6554_1 /TAXON_ID=641309 /ORGANISM="Lotharella oceanica, Strain CCMP622" /LENGTH=105 /DNA_ID=CAMNT_0010414389 /DNA_START=47 /DNA_END=364 /DNA_ORIENTATION=+